MGVAARGSPMFDYGAVASLESCGQVAQAVREMLLQCLLASVRASSGSSHALSAQYCEELMGVFSDKGMLCDRSC